MTGRERQASRLYMGVDISKGSPSSTSRSALYSVALVDSEGRLVSKYDDIALARLIRLAWYYKPVKIAFDNIMELASNKKSLERVLELFPPESEIVQVTLTSEGPVSVRELAAPYRDVVGHGKLRPGRTAYLLALLASQGKGYTVRRMEQKTKIIVSKGRNPSGGGFSQQRYQRRIRASVLNAAMRVKEALDKAGLEYDFHYRKSEGGIESAVFTVYAPRDRLYGVVRPHRGVDYNIIIKPEYRVVLSLTSMGGEGQPKTPIIVGIDPGITTGIAVIDLKGRVLFLDSSKNYDRGRLIEEVSSRGRAIIVAVDVSNPPEAVRKVAAQLGAQLYYPPEDLSVAQKRELASKALGGAVPVDTHQRDALAAAYKAYLALKSKLGHVDSQLRKLGLDIDSARVKEAVIRGLTVAEAVEEAIKERLESIEEEPKKKRETEKREEPRDRHVEERLRELEAEVSLLRRSLRELREENERLRYETEKLVSMARSEAYRDSLVLRLEQELNVLQAEADRLRNKLAEWESRSRRLEEMLVALWTNRVALIPRTPSLTLRNIRRLKEMLGSLEGEALYLDTASYDPDALPTLRDEGVLGVIVGSGGLEKLRKHASRLYIPVVTLMPGEILYSGLLFILAPMSTLDRLREERRRLEEARLSSFSLERLIREYRAERAMMGRKRRGP